MGVQAAVYGDHLAADIGAFIRAEIDTGVADILGTAVPVDHDIAQENILQYLDKHQDYVVTETIFAQTGGTRGWAVRTPRYKYVLYEAGKNREMLYDMETDRGEMMNLAIEKRYSDELQRHREILKDWMIEHYRNEQYPSTRFIPVTNLDK